MKWLLGSRFRGDGGGGLGPPETFLEGGLDGWEQPDQFVEFQKLKSVVNFRLHRGQENVAFRFPELLGGIDEQAPTAAADIIGFGQVEDKFFPLGGDEGLEGLADLGKRIGVNETLELKRGHVWVDGMVMDADRDVCHGS